MKTLATIIILFLAAAALFGQNEQAPIIERDITYKNWTYRSVRDDSETDLRALSQNKRLVVVVYYAPWCGNWRYDAPMLQRLYEKYRSKGLEIVGVGEYDPLASMKANLDIVKVTFPLVYESQSRADREKTRHYEYRRAAGDTRNWGSPWYIFLPAAVVETKGDVLVRRAHVINGEMIEAEGEKFIREKLGLPKEP